MHTIERGTRTPHEHFVHAHEWLNATMAHVAPRARDFALEYAWLGAVLLLLASLIAACVALCCMYTRDASSGSAQRSHARARRPVLKTA